ncbi:Helix-turn-helix [Duganella sp. OV458]|nr:Helix-turn-helix [Duganella sp. OV458]SDJ52120.1 Helix-turn-helix [Duganella sp. OV510]
MTTNKSLPFSDEELEKYEATRDLYAELKQGAKDIAAGRGRIVYSPLIAARKNAGLSQAEFAEYLGVTASTLEEWEQQRTIPDATTLILINTARDDPAAFWTQMRALSEGD